MRLDLYFARKYLRALILVAGMFAGLLLMLESIEQIRKLSPHDVPGATILKMALLRLPNGIYEILPIIVMIATLVLFLGLARSSELVVARASGRSALRSLVPPVVVTLLFGSLCVGVLNPIVAATERKFERESAYLTGNERQVFSVSAEGLWLREGNSTTQTVIRASRSNLDGTLLWDVSFFGFADDGTPLFQIEAKSARIDGENWVLTDAKRWPLFGAENPEVAATTHETLTLATNLTQDEIRDRFGEPASISIWDLQDHIAKLEVAGFSARSYAMWLQSELALPLSMVAMMLIAAGFTMRHTRLGNTSSRVTTAIILSFGFYFLRSFAIVMGKNALLPIMLAAWAPPIAILLATLALLLHLEDG